MISKKVNGVNWHLTIGIQNSEKIWREQRKLDLTEVLDIIGDSELEDNILKLPEEEELPLVSPERSDFILIFSLII